MADTNEPSLAEQAAAFAKQLTTAKRWVRQLHEMDPATRKRVLLFVADCFGLAVTDKPTGRS